MRKSGAVGDGTGDDTAAFLKAEDAALAATARFPNGPSGRPQAVVYVPPGTYRLLRLAFRSDVRMEVDAGAVLAQAGGRNVDVSRVPALIQWDGPPGDAVKNVSLVGVNSSAGGRKQLAEPLFPGWTVDPDFTFDLDPGFTGSNEAVAGVQALNVDGFLIQNVFSIENDSQPKSAPGAKQGWWPQSRKAALGLRERSDAPADGSAYYDPHNGTIENWYNVHGPKGFGPNQVNAGHNLMFRHIFSRGGTSMRFETDASQGKGFASELRGVEADDIAGENCNRAVSFAPHAQNNYDVHVSKVQAMSCAAGVIESFDESNKQSPGKFADSTITDVTVTSGNQAQDSLKQSSGLWAVDISETAFAKDSQTRSLWSVVYGDHSCSGSFTKPSDEIMTAQGLERPKCR
ncbi:MAG: hypothetical protein QOF81_1170 [Acidimicrobiaceae bacterium]|nr:hypothetical protein [Acidimicrobiaceae bacterium]